MKPKTRTKATLLACWLLATQAQAQAQRMPAPTPAEAAAAARVGAEQDQQLQQQRDTQQREAMINAPSVRSTREPPSDWPTLPDERPCFRIDAFAFENLAASLTTASNEDSDMLSPRSSG
ncbi:hypothetical protein [Pandoraea horticolens]|uniref:hypothetical protein n=1 Tax=Pandoraea horticolens TaxID=2508298 RepID=UPI001C2CF68B